MLQSPQQLALTAQTNQLAAINLCDSTNYTSLANELRTARKTGLPFDKLDLLDVGSDYKYIDKLAKNGVFTKEFYKNRFNLYLYSNYLPPYIYRHLHRQIQAVIDYCSRTKRYPDITLKFGTAISDMANLQRLGITPSINCYHVSTKGLQPKNSGIAENYTLLTRCVYEGLKLYANNKRFFDLIRFLHLIKRDNSRPKFNARKDQILIHYFGFKLDSKNDVELLDHIVTYILGQTHKTIEANKEVYFLLRNKYFQQIPPIIPDEQFFKDSYKVISFICSNTKLSKSDLQIYARHFETQGIAGKALELFFERSNYRFGDRFYLCQKILTSGYKVPKQDNEASTPLFALLFSLGSAAIIYPYTDFASGAPVTTKLLDLIFGITVLCALSSAICFHMERENTPPAPNFDSQETDLSLTEIIVETGFVVSIPKATALYSEHKVKEL